MKQQNADLREALETAEETKRTAIEEFLHLAYTKYFESGEPRVPLTAFSYVLRMLGSDELVG